MLAHQFLFLNKAGGRKIIMWGQQGRQTMSSCTFCWTKISPSSSPRALTKTKQVTIFFLACERKWVFHWTQYNTTVNSVAEQHIYTPAEKPSVNHGQLKIRAPTPTTSTYYCEQDTTPQYLPRVTWQGKGLVSRGTHRDHVESLVHSHQRTLKLNTSDFSPEGIGCPFLKSQQSTHGF